MTKYRPPVYGLGPMPGTFFCGECGAVVLARHVHSDWHEALTRPTKYVTTVEERDRVALGDWSPGAHEEYMNEEAR